MSVDTTPTSPEMAQLQLGRPVPRIAGRAMDTLRRYAWPGNIRELVNVLERGVLLNTTDVLTLEDLPLGLSTSGAAPETAPAPTDDRVNGAPVVPDFAQSRAEAITQFELRYLQTLLRSVNGRVGDAVRVSGIRPRTLYTLMRRHGLHKEDFRA